MSSSSHSGKKKHGGGGLDLKAFIKGKQKESSSSGMFPMSCHAFGLTGSFLSHTANAPTSKSTSHHPNTTSTPTQPKVTSPPKKPTPTPPTDPPHKGKNKHLTPDQKLANLQHHQVRMVEFANIRRRLGLAAWNAEPKLAEEEKWHAESARYWGEKWLLAVTDGMDEQQPDGA